MYSSYHKVIIALLPLFFVGCHIKKNNTPQVTSVSLSQNKITIQGKFLDSVTEMGIEDDIKNVPFQITSKTANEIQAYPLFAMNFILSKLYQLTLWNAQAEQFPITVEIPDGSVTSAKLATPYVPIAGGTMTGALNLPTNGLIAGTNQLVISDGKVGVGTSSPGQALSVAGTIESTTGGIKYPDGTIQTTGILNNYLQGMVLSNNGSSVKSLAISAGMATDSTNTYYAKTTGTYYKTLAGSWTSGAGSIGSPVNGLDAGSVAVSTWYHVYAIYSPSASLSDFIFSTSASSPTLPSGYTAYRRIGSVKTDDSSSNIIAFKQKGGWFIWVAPTLEISAQSLSGTTFTNIEVNVPPGISVEANMVVQIYFGGGGVGHGLWVGNPSVTNVVQSQLIQAAAAYVGGTIIAWTNTSQQLTFYASTSTGNLYGSVMQWYDPRGTEN